jgi:hypothetical protein
VRKTNELPKNVMKIQANRSAVVDQSGDSNNTCEGSNRNDVACKRGKWRNSLDIYDKEETKTNNKRSCSSGT